ncbi:MAG: TIGR00730 family Rossman fold protein [Patescibacteria group bacterium]
MKNIKQFDYKENAAWRMFRIMGELTDGFEFISSLKKAVTIFGSAVLTPDDKWYQEAVKLGRLLSQGNYDVITGGGPGIMEAANRGSFGDGHGDSVGLNIKLPREQRINPYVERSIAFHYFFTRKVCMSFAANAYVYFPGGFGTFDELFEITTLVQTGKIEYAPIILVGKKFWKPFLECIQMQMVEGFGTVKKEDMKLFTLVNSADEAYTVLVSMLGRGGKGSKMGNRNVKALLSSTHGVKKVTKKRKVTRKKKVKKVVVKRKTKDTLRKPTRKKKQVTKVKKKVVRKSVKRVLKKKPTKKKRG